MGPAEAGTRGAGDRIVPAPPAAWQGAVAPLEALFPRGVEGDIWNIPSGKTPEKLQTRKPPILRTTHQSVSLIRRHFSTPKESSAVSRMGRRHVLWCRGDTHTKAFLQPCPLALGIPQSP